MAYYASSLFLHICLGLNCQLNGMACLQPVVLAVRQLIGFAPATPAQRIYTPPPIRSITSLCLISDLVPPYDETPIAAPNSTHALPRTSSELTQPAATPYTDYDHLEFILPAGAADYSTTATDHEKSTSDAWLELVRAGDEAAVRAYLSAHPTAKDDHDALGNSAFMLAIEHRHPTIAAQLRAAGADVTSANNYGQTALDLIYLNKQSLGLRSPSPDATDEICALAQSPLTVLGQLVRHSRS